MRVSATQNQKTDNREFNPFKWAATGALVGYVVKNELHVTDYEREQLQYDERIAKSNAEVSSIVQDEINAIKKMALAKKDDEALDLFVKYNADDATKEAKDIILDQVGKKDPKVKDAFNALLKQIADKTEEAKAGIKRNFDSTTIRLRRYSSYLGIGALIATTGAFVWHVISRMSSEPEA